MCVCACDSSHEDKTLPTGKWHMEMKAEPKKGTKQNNTTIVDLCSCVCVCVSVCSRVPLCKNRDRDERFHEVEGPPWKWNWQSDNNKHIYLFIVLPLLFFGWQGTDGYRHDADGAEGWNWHWA